MEGADIGKATRMLPITLSVDPVTERGFDFALESSEMADLRAPV